MPRSSSTHALREISGSGHVSEIGDCPGGRQYESPSFVYDLRSSEGSGGSYFAEVAGFSKKVVQQAEKYAGAILDRYFVHAVNVLREPPASRGEVAVDFLMVGAAIALYGSSARRVPDWVLAELQRLSWKCGRPAATTGILYNALSRTFMKVHEGMRVEARGAFPADPENLLDEFVHLIGWLACTGDMADASRCLVNWASVLRTLPRKDACQWIENAQEFFRWFESAANDALGEYTRGVPGFLETERARSSHREDRFLRRKKPVAYHVAMVATEIGNRAMRREFARCARKVVLLPACMRGANARTCPGGQSGGLDVHCSGCDSNCHVCRASKVMTAAGLEIYVENCPRKSLRLPARWGSEPHTGIVIVACLANMRALQLAARWPRMTCQFLPLDFPGCQSHWRKARIPTTLNAGELDRLITGTLTRKS